MAGVKDYFKEQSREEKLLSGWSVIIWDYAHLFWSDWVRPAKSACGYFSDMCEESFTDLTQFLSEQMFCLVDM